MKKVFIKFTLEKMRVTLEISERQMREIQRATRERKKSPALAQALEEFLEHRRKQAFLEKVLAGKTDYAATNDEVENLAPIER